MNHLPVLFLALCASSGVHAYALRSPLKAHGARSGVDYNALKPALRSPLKAQLAQRLGERAARVRVATSLHAANPLSAMVLASSAGKSLMLGNANPWAIWSVLSCLSTLGLASEWTRIGRSLSSPLVTMLGAMILCNIGVLPLASSQYQTVTKYFVALAIPSLLLDADLKRCIRSTGPLLKAFLVGACGSVVGSIVAYALVPMRDILGGEKIAAAICSRHIGGAVNFVCVADILKIPPELIAASMAADNVLVALYFCLLLTITAPDKDETMSEFVRKRNEKEDRSAIKTTTTSAVISTTTTTITQNSAGNVEGGVCPLDAIFGTTFSSSSKDSKTDATSIVAERTLTSTDSSVNSNSGEISMRNGNEFSVLNVSSAVTVSLLICAFSHTIGSFYGVTGMMFTSAFACLLGTLFPRSMSTLARPGGVMGVFLMQFFFAVIGAQAHLPTVFRLAPSVFRHAFIQIGVHFLFSVVVGRNILNISFREIALASNANIGVR